MSSILHEIYSYAGARFTYDAVHSVLSNAKSLLRENGRIIIKDPAKPESPDEDLIFTLPAHDGINHDGEGLLFEAPSKLSTKAKYHRFLKEFHPLQKNPHHRFHTPINTENNTYKAPAWLLSEFLRHRSLDFSPEIWYSEMMEMYGVFTVDEAKQAMINNGFTNVQVNTHFNPDNHSAIKNDEIQIWSSDGKPQRQSDRLPTGMLIIADNLSSQRVM